MFERNDEPLFPVLALREALLNALAHRDYASPGGSVHVAIFAARIEIANPGTLPPGVELAEL